MFHYNMSCHVVYANVEQAFKLYIYSHADGLSKKLAIFWLVKILKLTFIYFNREVYSDTNKMISDTDIWF